MKERLGFMHNFAPGKSKITLLLLHGTGGDENSLIELGKELHPDAGLLSPRGKVLENGMPRYFKRFSEGIFDIEDLNFRTYELADFIKNASSEYKLDPKKIIAVGFSNGANISAAMLLLKPEVLLGAILFRATFPFKPKEKNNRKAAKGA